MRIFLYHRMRKIFQSRITVASIIVLGGLLIAAGVFVSVSSPARSSLAASPVRWTEDAGAGISVPACASASNSAPTCDGPNPSVDVTYGWTINNPPESHGYVCTSAKLYFTPASTIQQSWQTASTNSGPAQGANFCNSGSNTCGIVLERRFTANANYTLASVRFLLSSSAQSGTGVYVTVETDAGGVPSGTILATSNSRSMASFCDGSCSGLWTDPAFVFQGVNLTAGTTYWLVLRVNYLAWGDYIVAASGVGDPDPAAKSFVYRFSAGPMTDLGSTQIDYATYAYAAGTSQAIVPGLPCTAGATQTYEWTGGAVNTAYGYTVAVQRLGQTCTQSDINGNCIDWTTFPIPDDVSQVGSFTTPTSCGVSNQPPIAEAGISLDGTTFSNSITVLRGTPVTVWLSANRDVTGDSLASRDPDGWTDAAGGVSNGGKCEWNVDLRSPGFSVQRTVLSPASPAACNQGPLAKTFNDSPGVYSYDVLRITDTTGNSSNIGTVFVTVSSPVSVSLVANPVRINPGGTSVLRWDTTGFGPGECTIDQGIGSVAPDGMRSVSLLQTTVYTLSCSNGADSASTRATVSVSTVPDIREVPPR